MTQRDPIKISKFEALDMRLVFALRVDASSHIQKEMGISSQLNNIICKTIPSHFITNLNTVSASSIPN